jgi:hypothetical protein
MSVNPGRCAKKEPTMNPCVRIVAITALVISSAAASVDAQIWALQINNANRFTVLSQFSNQAVLDRETGLVWERAPGTEQYPWLGYPTAHTACNVRIVGNRLGWRLPTIQALASIVEPNRFSPNLPAGHPFTLSPEQVTGTFWSATTAEVDVPDRAWFLWFLSGSNQVILFGQGDKTTPRYVWCVRGFKGTDIQ